MSSGVRYWSCKVPVLLSVPQSGAHTATVRLSLPRAWRRRLPAAVALRPWRSAACGRRRRRTQRYSAKYSPPGRVPRPVSLDNYCYVVFSLGQAPQRPARASGRLASQLRDARAIRARAPCLMPRVRAIRAASSGAGAPPSSGREFDPSGLVRPLPHAESHIPAFLTQRSRARARRAAGARGVRRMMHTHTRTRTHAHAHVHANAHATRSNAGSAVQDGQF